LNKVALRDDAPALALRGIAMAQLGDFVTGIEGARRGACRHVVRDAPTVVSLARRPVLFALARALGEAWPGDVRGTYSLRGHSERSSPMNRIAHGCGSRSGGFARCCGRWPA
jgi:hypothetical protein